MSIKTLTAIATTIFAATFWFTATAQAGCGGKHGFSKNYSTSASYKAKRRAKARAVARARAKAKAKAIRLAKARAKARAKAKALRLANAKKESSFVATRSTAALLTEGDVKTGENTEKPNQKIADTETEATENTVVAIAEETGCKRFVPTVGRTISVACE